MRNVLDPCVDKTQPTLNKHPELESIPPQAPNQAARSLLAAEGNAPTLACDTCISAFTHTVSSCLLHSLFLVRHIFFDDLRCTLTTPHFGIDS